MKKVILVLAAIFLAIGIGNAFADDLEVDLSCPTTVSYGTGTTTFYATVSLKNWDCTNDSWVQRYMTGLVANPDPASPGGLGNNMGGLGIYGPFPRMLASAKKVPHANCTPTCTNPDGCPGTVAAFSVPVATVPPDTTGKVAMAMVDFFSTTGKPRAGGSCMVAIVP